jgi:hypothetical protein
MIDNYAGVLNLECTHPWKGNLDVDQVLSRDKLRGG